MTEEDVKSIIAQHRLLYAAGVVCSLVNALLFAIFAFKLGQIIDIIGQPDGTLYMRIAMCAGIIAIWFGVSSLHNMLMSRYAFHVILDTKREVYAALHRKEMNEFMSAPQAHYLNVLTKNIDILHDNYLVPRCEIVANAVSAAVSICAIFFISWKLALAFMVVTLITIVCSQLPGALMAKMTSRFSEESSSYLKVISNHLEGFEQIKLLRLFPQLSRSYNSVDEGFERSRRAYFTATWTAQSFGMFFSFCAQLACLGVGVFFVLHGQLTLGLLVAAINLLNSVFNPIQSFAHNKNLMGTVAEVSDEFTRIMAGDGDMREELCQPIRSISFQDVSMGFEDGRPLIKDFSYRFEAGKTYALKGTSGCGKSTLMKLLMHYYPKSSYTGNILVNSQNIEEVSSDSLCEHIAFIQRNEFFLPGSVADNIQLHRTDVEPAQLCANLQLSDELLAKDIEVGSRTQVSLGEKQRIDIARFLVNDYDVLIFDEPTSNLDEQTARVIFDLIFSQTNNIVIVITHDPNTKLLNRFDEVIDVARYNAHQDASALPVGA